MHKFFRFTLLGLVFLVLALVMTEGFIRWRARTVFIQNPGETGKGTIKQQAMRDFVQQRINSLWARSFEEKKYFYEPPFEVFVNRGFDDTERIKFIASRAKIPPNEKVTLPDFLRRDPDSSSLYTVTSNSLGFRGKEHSVKKAPNTFRIIVLGSYPAFGHAVNDAETYSAYLEKSLNTESKIKFEVWNGGRQGGSSIMGLARLEYEVDAYSPDLIIWDYGWIEKYLMTDLSSRKTAGEADYPLVKRQDWMFPLISFCYTVRDSISICNQIINKFERIDPEAAEKSWKATFELAKAWVTERHLPMIFLWYPGVSLSENLFRDSEAPADRIHYLNTGACIFGHPLTEAEINQFWAKNNWLTEMGFTKESLPKDEEGNLYFQDAIQYNAFAYKRVAGCLQDMISKNKMF